MCEYDRSTQCTIMIANKYGFVYYCWLVRITLVVAFGFCPKTFGGGRDLRTILMLFMNAA